MADDTNLNIRVTADASGVQSGLSRAAEAVAQFQQQLNTVGGASTNAAAGLKNLSAATESYASVALAAGASARSQAADINSLSAATESYASIALASAQNAREQASAFEGSGNKIKVNAGEVREGIVLLHEILTDRFSKIPGSLLVMGGRLGGLDALFTALTGTTGLWIAGLVTAAAATAYLVYQLVEEQKAVEEISATMLLSGQTGPGMQFDNIRVSIDELKKAYGATTSEARSVSQAFAGVTSVTEKQRQALEGAAVAMAHYSSGDAKKIAEELVKHIESGAKGFSDWAVKIGAVTVEEKKMLDTLGEGAEIDAITQKVIEFSDRTVGAFERASQAFKNWISSMSSALAEAPGGYIPGLNEQAPPSPARPGSVPVAPPEYGAFLRNTLSYTPEQAQALLGQASVESGFNPMSGVGTAHQGLFQWDEQRFERLKVFASEIGGLWSDWKVQLQFANKELHSMAPSFFTAEGLGEKTRILTGQFEIPARPGTPEFQQEYANRLRASEGQAQVSRQTPQEADQDRAIASGNKKLEEQRTLETEIKNAALGLQATVEALGVAENSQNGVLADELKKRAEEQRQAITNLELRKAGVHTEQEAAEYRTKIAELETRSDAARRINDQKQLLAIAKERAAVEQQYAQGGSTDPTVSAEARARAAKLVQAAEESATKDALEVRLNAIRTEAAANSRGSQERVDAIKAEMKAYDEAGLQNVNERRQLNVQLAAAERQLNDENYREFVSAEKLKIQELKGQPAAITAVYDVWLDKLKSVYAQDQKEYDRVLREKVAATQQATQQSISDEMRRIQTITTVDQARVRLDQLQRQARADVAGDRSGGGRISSLQAEMTEVAQAASDEEKLYQAVADRTDATVQEKERAYEQIAQLAERAAEREIALQKQVADAMRKSADEAAKPYEQLFSNIESAGDKALSNLFSHQETAKQNIQHLGQSLAMDLIKTIEGGASTGLAHLISPTLGEGKGIGDLLGRWTSQGVSALFGGGGGSQGAGVKALDTASQLSADQVKQASAAFQQLQSILGINTAVTQTATSIKTAETAAVTTSTTAVTATQGATVLNTGATAANTIATEANSGAQGGGGIFGFIGKAAGGIGSLFGLAKGGIIPSAAGGFLVPGSALDGGGQLSILHSNEMVLPAPISQGLQTALGEGGIGGNNTANLTYAPTINGPGPFATRAQAETFFRQHGDVLLGQASNLIRNGWRP